MTPIADFHALRQILDYDLQGSPLQKKVDGRYVEVEALQSGDTVYMVNLWGPGYIEMVIKQVGGLPVYAASSEGLAAVIGISKRKVWVSYLLVSEKEVLEFLSDV